MAEEDDAAVLDLRLELARELAAAPDQWTGIDLLASIAFLYGQRGQHGGVEHLKPKSFEERESRQALARLLRGPQPLSRIVRNLLANLIDTDSRDVRIICLKRRSKARLPSARDYDIAYFIAWKVEAGQPMKNAKDDAAKHFKVAKATMNRAWGKHGKAMRGRVHRILSELKKPYIPRR